MELQYQKISSVQFAFLTLCRNLYHSTIRVLYKIACDAYSRLYNDVFFTSSVFFTRFSFLQPFLYSDWTRYINFFLYNFGTQLSTMILLPQTLYYTVDEIIVIACNVSSSFLARFKPLYNFGDRPGATTSKFLPVSVDTLVWRINSLL